MNAFRTVLLLALVLVLIVPARAFPLAVSNVQAGQRPGTKLVDITYDLADLSGATVAVSLQVSADGGATWTIPVAGAAGDIGPGVTTGPARKIVWDAGANWNNNFSASMRFRVLADIGDAVPSGFALIPGGTFLMGDQSAPAAGYPNELPVHAVTVTAFYLSKTEVTYAEWLNTRDYAAANGYTFNHPGQGKGADHPVHSISWYDAVKWCNARSQQAGLQPSYTVNGFTYKTGLAVPVCNFAASGYRLPTEAEWEKAARGGIQGKNFPWGLDTISHSQANYNSFPSYSYDITPTSGYHPAYGTGPLPYTSPAGALPSGENAYGLRDMSGNLWEWCWDWHSDSYYAVSPSTDPPGPSSGTKRVLRGGSWAGSARSNRTANRGGNLPADAYYSLGFRIATSVN